MLITTTQEAPPKVPTNLFWDIDQMQPTPRCSKPILVLGDFEDCYKELLQTIKYIDLDRCYRVEQHQQTVWISSKGTQLVKLPNWCSQ